MKKLLLPFFLGISTIGLVLALTGCLAAPVAQPPVITQGPTGPVTNQPPPIWAPSPAITTASNIATGLAGAAAAVPVAAPYAALASWLIPILFGALGAGAGSYAQSKNTAQSNTMLTAVIQGVEAATSNPTVTAALVKAAIQSRATAAGVQPALDKVVQAAT